MRFVLSILGLSAALLVTALLIGRTADTASALQETVTVTLGSATGPAGGGSQTGTATLTASGNQTEVVVNILAGDAADEPQPIHIHQGTCDDLPDSLGGIQHDLTDGGTTGVVGGSLTATVDATLDSLQTGDFAINIHNSGTELGVYVSCGNIPTAAAAVPSTGGPPAMPGGSTSTQSYLLIAAGALAVLAAGTLFLRLRQQ